MREATKQVIKKELYDKLVEDGILAEGSDKEKYQDVAPIFFSDSEQVRYDPRLEIRLRELDLEIKKTRM